MKPLNLDQWYATFRRMEYICYTGVILGFVEMGHGLVAKDVQSFSDGLELLISAGGGGIVSSIARVAAQEQRDFIRDCPYLENKEFYL